MYHLRRIKTMMLLLLVCVVAKAQPEAGKVYRFVNKAHPEQSLAAVSATRSSISATADHYLQYWLLEKHPGNESAWTLRNLGNGMYLQHAGTSTPWSFVNTASSATQLYYAEEGGYCTFNSANNTSGWACMHYGAGPGCIVGWEFAGAATQWTMTEVSSVTSEQLAQNWADLTEYYAAQDENAIEDCASALDALFADAACTTLESTYVDMSVADIQEDANYKALPAALQELVLKVRNGVWTEANFVDGKAEWESDQAKKFRVQLYEPHSIAGDITEWLGINAHNNMDNPTGIFADCRDVVYVMVEGSIKEGASLYLYGLRGHGQMGSYNDGNAVQLHEGLNVVPYISDGNALWINYVVDTYNGNGSTDEERFPHKLSEYEPLKINIAGGYINGYYNAVGDALWGGPDDDNDWAYYKDRASLESFTLLSHRVTMQFYMYTTNGSPGLYDLLDNIQVPTEKPYCFSGTMGTPATFSQYEGMGLDASTGKINIMLEAWNRITYSEFATLGVLNEATIDKMNEKYPRWYNNWTERGKIYDYTTGNDGRSYKEYCGGVDYSEYFNHHCLAISNTTGYMSGGWKSSNYNINTAESIIDRIAYEAGPVWGPAHEIGHQHQALFTLNGLTEVTNNLHSNVAVWYMGMGTSRMNGTDGSLASVLEAFNTEGSDYYTNNIWALTQMYYRLWLYYHLAGNNTQFYPRLMENLRREPLEKGYNVGPGGLLRFYKHCCVAAGEDLTEFFRAHGLLSVMTDRLVGDYSNSVYNQSQEQIDAAIAEVKDRGLPENIAPLFISDATPDVTYGHDGTTQRSYWDGNNTISGNNAEVGSYIDFIDSEPIGTAPTLTIEGTTVTIDNLDGVGIAIFNEKGEIVGFSTKSTFELSEECAALLASGEAVVKAVNADKSMVAIEVTDPTQIQYDLLGSLLEEANSMLALSDSTNTKPGFYKLSALDALKDAYSVAKNVYDEREVNSYSAAYEILKLACDELGNNADAIIAIKAGYTYWLENRQTAGKYIAVNDSKALIGSSYSKDDTKQQWVFEAAGEEDIYYIKNVSTQTYLGDLANEVQISATADKEGAIGYRAISLGNGVWALQCQNTAAKALNYYTWNGNNQIIGWDYEGEKTGSHWYLTAVGLDDNVENLYALQDLIEDTEALMAEVGKVAVGETETVTLTESNYYCNATYTEDNGDKFTSYSVLCDGNINTYLHTDYSGNDSDDGLAHYIRMDMGENNTVEMFKITYTTRNHAYPLAPTSITVEGSNDLNTWHTIVDAFTEGLPEEKGTSFTTPVLSNGLRYRYVRLIVNSTITNQEAGPTDNKHRYFALSELGISNVTPAESLNTTYESMTEGVLLDAFKANLAAQGVLITATTSAEYKAAYTTLETKYNALLAAKKVVDDAALNAKKAELQTLINNMTSLISSCGTVTYTPATYSGAPKLQTSDSNADFYVWTNAQEADEGPIANLVDGNNNTFFHSDYSGANSTDGLDHHITINLGEGNEVSSFTFGYVTRHNADTNYPETIEVYGSENGTDYELLTTVSGLPSGNTQTYNSGEAVVASKFYSNLRFMVTATNNNNKKGGHPIFHMAEFTLTAIGTPESYTVELGNDAGGATNALMLAAYKESASAQATHTMATTLSQVEAAIANLQADYDALKSAKETIVEETYRVQVIGGNANGGVVYDGNNYMNTASFKSSKDLTVDALTAIPLDGYAEAVVTLNGTTITVTYNKVYTVQVDGGDDTGGVIYDNNNYLNDATITVLQDIDAAQLAAIAVSGYNRLEVTLNGTTITVTYRKVYTVQVAGVQDAGGVSFGGSGYAHEATITVSQDIDEAQLTAQNVSGYNAGVITVDHETKVITVTYTMTPLVDSEKYYTLRCWDGSAHGGRFISDDGTAINGHSTEGTLFHFEAANDENGYYIKSYVSDKYLNVEDQKVVAGTEKTTVWTMATSSHTTGAMILSFNNEYLNNNGAASNSCPYLQLKAHGVEPGNSAYCSLWKLTEGTPIDKSALNTLIGETYTLIESCYTDEEFNYAGSLNVTEVLVNATRETVAVAQEKYDSKATTESEYEAALNALQTAKDNLQTAINYAEFPVQLTFDANTPVTYKIAIDRSASSVLAYDQNSAMVAVAANFVLGNKAHGWYFMPAADGKVYIMPYYDNNTTLALSTNNFSEGNSKVKGMAVGSDGYTQGWTITNANMSEGNRNAGWYNITCTSNGTDTWYFSNHGGVANKMGFLNDANDGGSRFKFDQITFDKSEAYYTLYNYYMSETKVASNTITGNDAVGYYPVDAAKAYNTAYGTATAVLENTTATDDDYTNAYNALVAANEALEINMPEEGKYYRFVSADVTNNRVDGVVYANPADNKMYWSKDKATTDATAIWIIVPANNGTFHISNLHTGTSISSFIGNNPSPLSDIAGEARFVSISTDGQLMINCSGTMHAQAGGAVVTWNTGANDASAWRIVEVDMANVKFDMTIGQYGHVGLYLNYPVLIPAAVKAYIIDGSDVEIENGEGTLTLKQIEGSVLPAKTAVILEAEPNSYSFYYTDNEANVGTNLLTGSAYQTYREAETNHNYYIFGRKDDVVGLYKNSVVYDATGAEGDTHYKMSANKVLFDWDNSAGNVNAFRFRIDGEETGIEEVTVGAEDTIYDLYGRRLAEVTTSGLYIVNGEKRYVKVK